jgi:hypothetical protein
MLGDDRATSHGAWNASFERGSLYADWSPPQAQAAERGRSLLRALNGFASRRISRGI